jgi:hypothetical protein
MATGTPIPYAIVNGSRHSPVSLELKFNGLLYVGFKSAQYSRKRSRAMAKGNSPDPLGKTRGTNVYTASVEFLIAEFNQLIRQMGPGYGDQFFSVTCTYTENGFDTITDEILGCTIDSTEATADQTSDDPLYRMVELTPVKIRFDRLDDLLIPLAPPPT